MRTLGFIYVSKPWRRRYNTRGIDGCLAESIDLCEGKGGRIRVPTLYNIQRKELMSLVILQSCSCVIYGG